MDDYYFTTTHVLALVYYFIYLFIINFVYEPWTQGQHNNNNNINNDDDNNDNNNK